MSRAKVKVKTVVNLAGKSFETAMVSVLARISRQIRVTGNYLDPVAIEMVKQAHNTGFDYAASCVDNCYCTTGIYLNTSGLTFGCRCFYDEQWTHWEFIVFSSGVWCGFRNGQVYV